jgi:hypothetical protein
MVSTELIDCTNLSRGSWIDIETKSRHYRVECLGGNAVRISGHPEYCPEPTSARLHGSLNKQGSLEPGVIGRGMPLMFLLEGRQPVTTTRVVHLRVERAPRGLSSTIH